MDLHHTQPSSRDVDALSCSDMSISVESSERGEQSQMVYGQQEERCPSPTQSVISFGSVDAHLLRETHGRKFNAQNAVWMLPADSEEHNRLDIQHVVLSEALGGLFPAPDLVMRALAPKQDAPPGILDVGTGSGTWASQMARQFSHAQIVGIDLSPPIVQGEIPPNVRFEIDDVNLSLTHYAKCFDLVHCRSIDSGIEDFPRFLYNLAQVLRPNGVIIVARGGSVFYNERLQPMVTVNEGMPGFFPLQNIFMAMEDCYRVRWGRTRPPLAFRDWLLNNPNYTKVGSLAVYLPIGAWQPGLDERTRRVAELNGFNTLKIIKGFRPLLLEMGYDAAMTDRWIECASRDIENGTCRVFARWDYAWAVRRNTKWRAPPETQAIIGGS